MWLWLSARLTRLPSQVFTHAPRTDGPLRALKGPGPKGVEADVITSPSPQQISRFGHLVEAFCGLKEAAKLHETTRRRLAALIVDEEAWGSWEPSSSPALDAAVRLSKELKKYCDRIGLGGEAILFHENPEFAYYWGQDFKTDLARELYKGLKEVTLFEQVKLPPEPDITRDRVLATLGDEVVQKDRGGESVPGDRRYRSPALKQAFDFAYRPPRFASGDSINELARLGREWFVERDRLRELATRMRPRLEPEVRLGAWHECPLSRTTERLDRLADILKN